jgi:hypothetical protein
MAVICQEDSLMTGRRLGIICAAALAVAVLAGCNSGSSAAVGGNYFPLTANSTWTYQIDSKSQRTQYQITDRVLGRKYVPALKLTGSIVNESYSLARGGTRPLVYYSKNGFITRLSALAYSEKAIQGPSWGRSEERNFLPLHLAPNQSWKNVIYPYGHMAGAFEITQSHRTFLETREIDVPAGHFTHCIRIETNAQYEGGAYAQRGEHLKLAYIDWYAPNVGLIKTLALEGGPKGPVMERVYLVSYKIAPLQTASR